MDADLEFFRRVAGTETGLAVTIDQRPEAVRLAADDRDHQGQPEGAGANKGSWRASDSEPDGQRLLQRARVNALASQGRAVLARPMDMRGLADLQKEIEFLG